MTLGKNFAPDITSFTTSFEIPELIAFNLKFLSNKLKSSLVNDLDVVKKYIKI